MLETTPLILDFQAPNVAVVAYAKQNDRATRKLICQMVDGGTPWVAGGNIYAAIRFLKPDGTGGFYDTDDNGNPAIAFNGSQATLTLAEQVLTVPGTVYLELNIYNSQSERLTTFAFVLNVEASVLSDATIISSNYYNILTQQIADILGSIGAVAGLTADAHSIPKDQDAYVIVTGGTSAQDPYNLDFGLPRGYSPDLAITKDGNEVTITATDEHGTTSETITDPTAEVTQDGADITITMTDHNGTTTATVLRGSLLLATFDINIATGQLVMTAPANYTDLIFSINSDGQLEVTVNA